MEMVRQDADGISFERQAQLNRAIGLPQALDVLDKQLAGPVDKCEREKEPSAFDCWTPVSRHPRTMAWLQGWQKGDQLLPRGLAQRHSARIAQIEMLTACAKLP